MIKENSPEVLVVGAGPVGMFAALSLSRRGIRTEIVDTGIWACKHSYALAVQPQALSLFEEFGLAGALEAGAYPVRTIGLFDSQQRRAQIRLENAPMLVVRQDAIEELLEKKLREADVTVHWRHEVAALTPGESGVKVKINKLEKDTRGYVIAHTEWSVAKSEEFEVPYVIGADGYNSLVRRTLNLGYPEVGPAAYYAVFECKSDADLQNEMRLVLGEDTTDVLWPLPGGHCRWGFQLTGYSDPGAERIKDRLLEAGLGYFPTERTKDRGLTSEWGPLPVLEESRLHALIQERAPWFKAKIENVTWRTVIRFERRLATAFGHGRLWLAGDSAHLTGPAGIQSMNAGFFEAQDLAGALAHILREKGAASEFASYNDCWLTAWRQLHGSLSTEPHSDPWIAAHAGALMSCLPAHGAALNNLAAQLGLKA